MNRYRRLRLISVLVIGVFLGVAITLIFYALGQNINLFFTPNEVATGKALINKKIRLGGMVKKGSVFRTDNSLEVTFKVTDFKSDVIVVFKGILPDLFRESQGIVSEGVFDGEVFRASEVLAKHDENYMAPEVSRALEKGMSNQHFKGNFK